MPQERSLWACSEIDACNISVKIYRQERELCTRYSFADCEPEPVQDPSAPAPEKERKEFKNTSLTHFFKPSRKQ